MDELNYDLTVMSDDLYHSGSYAAPGLFTRGIIRSEDVNVLLVAQLFRDLRATEVSIQG